MGACWCWDVNRYDRRMAIAVPCAVKLKWCFALFRLVLNREAIQRKFSNDQSNGKYICGNVAQCDSCICIHSMYDGREVY